jgi:hypothetical protein
MEPRSARLDLAQANNEVRTGHPDLAADAVVRGGTITARLTPSAAWLHHVGAGGPGPGQGEIKPWAEIKAH